MRHRHTISSELSTFPKVLITNTFNLSLERATNVLKSDLFFRLWFRKVSWLLLQLSPLQYSRCSLQFSFCGTVSSHKRNFPSCPKNPDGITYSKAELLAQHYSAQPSVSMFWADSPHSFASDFTTTDNKILHSDVFCPRDLHRQKVYVLNVVSCCLKNFTFAWIVKLLGLLSTPFYLLLLLEAGLHAACTYKGWTL